MTRETKIGLLVGLAFIIVVGILLSDHMAATTELPQAPLETAEKTSHGAVVTPGETRTTEIAKIITPSDITPATPVPTREELTSRQPIVVPQQVIMPANPIENNPAVAQNPQPTPATHIGEIAQAAGAQGEQIVDPASGNTVPPVDIQPQPKPATVVATGPKTYVAQPGDNLNKIALKTMGASTKLTRAAILKANPDLAKNPDMIVAGATYNIPSATAPTATATGTTTATNEKVAVLPLKPVTPAPRGTLTASAANIYIVKDGDNSLWGIATKQLGTPQAVAAIKELNQDVLKGGDMIRVGMRLKMPAKPVQANS